MNSANAFGYAISGAYTDSQMQNHAEYVNQGAAMFRSAGGWLAQQADKAMESFNTFLNSRAWELGKRLLNQQDGEYVPRFEIGYLGTVHGLQNSQGYMRDFIMAHPGMQQDYLDGRASGYGGDFHQRCTGIAEENIFWRRAHDGVLRFDGEEDQRRLLHTHYQESIGGRLEWRDISNLQKTFTAIDYHRAKSMFDISSAENAKWGGADEAE